MAMDALIWIAGSDEMLGVFFGATGLDPTDLRQAAGETTTLAAILDFILLEDRWIQEFSTHLGVAPDQVIQARQQLPGGDLPNWT